MTTAKQVPAMVATHQSYLASEGYREYSREFFNSLAGRHMNSTSHRKNFTTEQWQQVADSWLQQQHDLLNISQLFHVSESMTEVAKIAAGQLDPYETWSQEILPALHGVLVFEHPLEVTDVWGRLVTIAAIHWTTDLKAKIISLSEYTDVTTPQDQYNQILSLQGILATQVTGRWSLGHVEALKFGQPLGNYFTDDDPEVVEYRDENKEESDTNKQWDQYLEPITPSHRPLFGNISHVLFSIFALMDQSITTLTEETDRRLQRRNKNKRRPPPLVTVIQLRRAETHGYHEEGTGRWLTYRSVTRGHWRRQPYKDGVIKRIWINPYIRGSSDLPFHQPKRVSTLAR